MLAKLQAKQPIVISSQCIYMQCLIGGSLPFPQGAGLWREAGTQHLPPALHFQAAERSQQKEAQTGSVKFPSGREKVTGTLSAFPSK